MMLISSGSDDADRTKRSRVGSSDGDSGIVANAFSESAGANEQLRKNIYTRLFVVAYDEHLLVFFSPIGFFLVRRPTMLMTTRTTTKLRLNPLTAVRNVLAAFSSISLYVVFSPRRCFDQT